MNTELLKQVSRVDSKIPCETVKCSRASLRGAHHRWHVQISKEVSRETCNKRVEDYSHDNRKNEDTTIHQLLEHKRQILVPVQGYFHTVFHFGGGGG